MSFSGINAFIFPCISSGIAKIETARVSETHVWHCKGLTVLPQWQHEVSHSGYHLQYVRPCPLCAGVYRTCRPEERLGECSTAELESLTTDKSRHYSQGALLWHDSASLILNSSHSITLIDWWTYRWLRNGIKCRQLLLWQWINIDCAWVTRRSVWNVLLNTTDDVCVLKVRCYDTWEMAYVNRCHCHCCKSLICLWISLNNLLLFFQVFKSSSKLNVKCP